MQFRFAWVASVLCLAGCSKSASHPAGASGDCPESDGAEQIRCNPGHGTIGAKGGNSTGGTDGGGKADAARPTTGLDCTRDPTAGLSLCRQSTLCPGIQIDDVTQQGCGFVDVGRGTVDVECLCPAGFLCPID